MALSFPGCGGQYSLFITSDFFVQHVMTVLIPLHAAVGALGTWHPAVTLFL